MNLEGMGREWVCRFLAVDEMCARAGGKPIVDGLFDWSVARPMRSSTMNNRCPSRNLFCVIPVEIRLQRETL